MTPAMPAVHLPPRNLVLLLSLAAGGAGLMWLATRRSIKTLAAVMPHLPSTVQKYSQVPPNGKCFTANKIPKGLLRQHNTKVGTWGVIRVKQGRLRYQINEPTVQIFELDSQVPGVIEPQIYHEVAALSDDLEFVVEFYREPGTGPVDEKREGL
eukprot:TRINITY_DN34593_c0_g1_i1.p1 TRINITY_DN34593_c0_g1~~TRINITY_DN34593_c0_g1_i1.p1  ORF type:complete len:154 (+),score=24.21 TRINITY_DN34593_c0_g1_i1:48-509(+)